MMKRLNRLVRLCGLSAKERNLIRYKMATPSDNTEVVRMLRDFKNAVYRSGTVIKLDSPDDRFRSCRARGGRTSNIATKLNFSNLDDSTKLSLASPSSRLPESSHTTPDVLKRKLASTELELHASKAALREKEAAMSLMEPANKKACLSLEQKLKGYIRQNEQDQVTIVKLKAQLKHAENEAASAKNRAIELEKEKKIECDKLEMKLLALQHECSDLKIELSEGKSERAEALRRLNSEIGRLELKLSSATREAAVAKEVNMSLKKEVQELTEKATQSIRLQEELHEAQSRIKVLEDEFEAQKDAALVLQARQSDLKLLSDVQKENQELKEEISKYKDSNVALFQEKMWAFQEKAADMDKKTAALARLEVENEKLVKKLTEWESLFDEKGNFPNRSPSAFSRRLSQYQKNEVLMANKLAKLNAHCETLEKQNGVLESALEQMKKSYEQLKESTGNYDPLVKRLRQRVFLLTKERDNCRKLIDTYVSETTLAGGALNTNHIKNLENTIEEYEKSLEKADEEVENLESQVKSLQEKVKGLEQIEASTKQLHEEKVKLLNQIEKLENEKSAFEEKLVERSKVKSSDKEKIIHLRSNPLFNAVKKRTEDFEALRDENDRLRKRIQVLEEEGASATNVTLRVEEKLEKEGSDTLLQNLKEQLAAAEHKNKMIIDAARSKSREFREAIYSLTGYKVDVPVSGKYRLSHVYADSPDDHLLFEVNSSGVHLLETEYSNHLNEQIETYLRTYDSVPAFLASVTLDLFKQQTYMAQRSISIE